MFAILEVSPEIAGNQEFGLGVLILVAAIITGYGVSRLVPKGHFPIIAGLLAGNALVAGLAVAGVAVAGHMVVWIALLSVWGVIHFPYD